MSVNVEDAMKRIEELRDIRKNATEEIKETYRVIKENTPKDSILVINPKIAKTLIKSGHSVIDIMPDRNDRSRKRTIFIFKLDDTIEEEFNALRDAEIAKHEYGKKRFA